MKKNTRYQFLAVLLVMVYHRHISSLVLLFGYILHVICLNKSRQAGSTLGFSGTGMMLLYKGLN